MNLGKSLEQIMDTKVNNSGIIVLVISNDEISANISFLFMFRYVLKIMVLQIILLSAGVQNDFAKNNNDKNFYYNDVRDVFSLLFF